MKKSFLALMIFIAVVISGCGRIGEDRNGETPVDFTVVEKTAVPEEFLTSIEQAKAEEFTMTAAIDGYLYIAVGYGQQPTGGYSIRVDSMNEGNDSITLHTTLLGPGSGEAVNKMATYPYIVLKIENTDKNIIFQ